jgi:hypothetical protein
MEIAKVVDYAPHIEELKRLVRDVYELANERKHKEAEEIALKLAVEAKLLLNAIRHNG